jgi:hypothetical protein
MGLISNRTRQSSHGSTTRRLEIWRTLTPAQRDRTDDGPEGIEWQDAAAERSETP